MCNSQPGHELRAVQVIAWLDELGHGNLDAARSNV